MWNLIPLKSLPPTRKVRYCCSVLKETATPNRMAALGVRAAESTKRQGRDTFGVRGGTYREAKFFSLDHAEEVHHEALDRDPVWDCTLIKTMRDKGDTIVNPIYEWEDGDVWEYIRENNVKTNPLYECGRHRVGCLFCPLSTYQEKKRDEAEFPKYKEAYIRAFERMNEERRLKNKPTQWSSGEDVYNWWLEEYKHNVKGQITMEEYLKGVDTK